MSLIITADLRGFRVRESVDLTGAGYELEDGTTFSTDRCWPATTFNLGIAAYLLATKQIAIAKKMMKAAENTYELAVEGIEAFALLRKQGYVLDDEQRIRRLMGPPYTEIHEDHIMPIIQTHLTRCEEEKKDPSVEPIEIGFVEGQVIFRYKDKIATGKQAGGTISLYAGKQIILSFMDWHYIPKGPNVGSLMQFLKCEPTGASSVKELCGKEGYVVEDGILITSGLRKLAGRNIDFDHLSIDQFI